MRGKILLIGLGISLVLNALFLSAVRNSEQRNAELIVEQKKAKFDLMMLQMDRDYYFSAYMDTAPDSNRGALAFPIANRSQQREEIELLRNIERNQRFQALDQAGVAEMQRIDDGYNQLRLQSLQMESNRKIDEVNRLIEEQNFDQRQQSLMQSLRVEPSHYHYR